MLYLFPERVETTASGALELHWRAGAKPFSDGSSIAFHSAVNEVLVLPAALSADECGRAQALGDARSAVQASVERGHAVDYRASTIAWIEPQQEAHWLYHRVAMLFLEANRKYRFDLTGFLDALQYTVYGPGDRFDWHIDLGSGSTSARKLSLSLLLNGESEYDGGRLEFGNVARSLEDLPAGTAVFFPSYLMHRISGIVRGTRRSLVAWGYGAPFR